MAVAHSPLRYPGGKQVLGKVLAHLIEINGARGGVYVEPYAGGAGAAISLLMGEHVDRVLINDADPCVYAFWSVVLHQTDRFVALMQETPTTIEEWERQRAIYQRPRRHSRLRVGFATFFLNRCNRSGIIVNGGPIGGKDQRGKWRINARFNRDDLAHRIEKISLYRDRIVVSNLDAIKFLTAHVSRLGPRSRPFVYLDPPYYKKGRNLYLSDYEEEDHRKLAAYLRERAKFLWVLSYDKVPEVARLYRRLRQVPFDLDYSARERRLGRELMILKPHLRFPREWSRGIPKEALSLADALSRSGRRACALAT